MMGGATDYCGHEETPKQTKNMNYVRLDLPWLSASHLLCVLCRPLGTEQRYFGFCVAADAYVTK